MSQVMPENDAQRELEAFLKACHESPEPLQPSRALDKVWHAYLADERGYLALCRSVGAPDAIPHHASNIDMEKYVRARDRMVPISTGPQRWWPAPRFPAIHK